MLKVISQLSLQLNGVMKELLLLLQAKMAKSRFGPEVACSDHNLLIAANLFMESAGALKTILSYIAQRKV